MNGKIKIALAFGFFLLSSTLSQTTYAKTTKKSESKKTTHGKKSFQELQRGILDLVNSAKDNTLASTNLVSLATQLQSVLELKPISTPPTDYLEIRGEGSNPLLRWGRADFQKDEKGDWNLRLVGLMLSPKAQPKFYKQLATLLKKNLGTPTSETQNPKILKFVFNENQMISLEEKEIANPFTNQVEPCINLWVKYPDKK